jgi:superoxide dismutase, Fe-Mn family
MKNFNITMVISLLLLFLVSCQEKKLTEIVEVPLPSVNDKITIGNPKDVQIDGGTFDLAKFPYTYEAFLPSLSAVTLEAHYGKKYLSYTNKLNKSIAETALEEYSIEEILATISAQNDSLKNDAGGYYNHTLYFKSIKPQLNSKKSDTLAATFVRDFGSFFEFEKQFKTLSNNQLGSSWVWLILDKTGKLQVTSTQNQDNPLMKDAKVKGIPLLVIDLWEHAYFLDYQFNRKKYIDDFFKFIDWSSVSERYEEAMLVYPYRKFQSRPVKKIINTVPTTDSIVQ